MQISIGKFALDEKSCSPRAIRASSSLESLNPIGYAFRRKCNVHYFYIAIPRVMRHLKIKLFSIFQLVDLTIMRQIQLEMIFYSAKIILGAEVDIGVSRTKIGRRDGK